MSRRLFVGDNYLERQVYVLPIKGFILRSPILTASKWWNGSLGRIANYAIVVAQLLLPKPGAQL
jgi:hypothetical protein